MKNILKVFILFLFSLNTIFALDLTKNRNTVIDSSTKLQWQDNDSVKMLRKNWDYATVYCQNLVLDGYTNWRLPSKTELLTLINYAKSNPAIKENAFAFITSNYYWSHTENAALSKYAWYIGFDTGLVGYDKKELREYVRCVRTIK